MLQFLISLLTPIFEGMGVSPTDVAAYVHNLSGYIYAILGTLVLAIVVITAAQLKGPKGKRHLVSWGAGLSWVLIVTILANVICFGPMYNNLAPILNYDGAVSAESAAASEVVIEKVGDEGIVLAENNGMLPLSGTDKINVFGWAATNPIYGGTGSGSSSNEGYNYYAASFTNNSESYDDFAPEESYLQLSRSERDMVDLVAANFDKVVVVVNANNAMELGFVNDYDSIGAVLLTPGTGRTAMNALGKILKGTVNPSGRTVETYVYNQKSTPAYNNYGSFTYDNVDDLLEQYTAFDPGFQGALSFVNYVEGIYVGYRFYKTAYAEAQAGNMTFDYNSVVQYPFGHGLSYTTFTQEIQNFSDSGNNITFDVVVTNTGSVAGKDVVEVYFTPPYNNGGIEKAAVNLVNFAKTDVLEPGASQTVSFTIPRRRWPPTTPPQSKPPTAATSWRRANTPSPSGPMPIPNWILPPLRWTPILTTASMAGRATTMWLPTVSRTTPPVM